MSTTNILDLNNRIDELEKTAGMLSDGVKSVQSAIEGLSTLTVLSSSSFPYKAPANGLIVVTFTLIGENYGQLMVGESVRSRVYSKLGSNNYILSQAVCPVRKGEIITLDGGGTFNAGMFIQL